MQPRDRGEASYILLRNLEKLDCTSVRAPNDSLQFTTPILKDTYTCFSTISVLFREILCYCTAYIRAYIGNHFKNDLHLL